nr:MAG TPA: hypothetical protein [Caudoviricetes sp.]
MPNVAFATLHTSCFGKLYDINLLSFIYIPALYLTSNTFNDFTPGAFIYQEITWELILVKKIIR